MTDQASPPEDFLLVDTLPPTPVEWEGEEPKVYVLTILCHPDVARVGEIARLGQLSAARDVRVSRSEPRFSRSEDFSPQPLKDLYISRVPLYIRLQPDKSLVLDASKTSTTVRVDGEVLEGSCEIEASRVDWGVRLLLANRVLLLLQRTERVSSTSTAPELVGESAPVLWVRRRIAEVAEVDHAVLVQGESGTGKELVARAIHEASPRRRKPFVAVNLASIRELVAAQLFGVVKGAYTGADADRPGFLQQADHGTLFLDEIGAASLEVQDSLLRALEDKKVRRVGAQLLETVDVRVIAATDKDLQRAVGTDSFRLPLLERLRALTITLPPLRYRLEDFGRLFFHFLRRELEARGSQDRLRLRPPEQHPWVPAELMDRLLDFHWPGNVRQLQNVVRQLALASHGKDTMQWDRELDRILGPPARRPIPLHEPSAALPLQDPTGGRAPSDLSRDGLLKALDTARGNIAATARRLGVSRATVYRLMREHAIPTATELGKETIQTALASCDGNVAEAASLLGVSKKALLDRMRQLGLAPS